MCVPFYILRFQEQPNLCAPLSRPRDELDLRRLDEKKEATSNFFPYCEFDSLNIQPLLFYLVASRKL